MILKKYFLFCNFHKFCVKFANSEFLLVMFETEVAANGYLVEDGCIWNESGLLLARSRQLAILLPKNPGDI